MSITIINSAPQQASAFHKFLWVFDSTNKTRLGFQYIIDVYSGAGTNFITRFNPPPRPGDGYGVFNPSVLRSLIDQSKDVYPELVGFRPARNSECHYRLLIGEKVDAWTFTDNFFSSGTVGFTSTTTQHGFLQGDRILVSQDAGYVNAQYEGYTTVLSVTSPYGILVNKPFGASSPLNPGQIRRADGTSIIVSGLTSGQTSWQIGYTLDVEELADFDLPDWSPGVTGSPAFLFTDMPQNFTMRETGRLLLSVPQYSGLVTSVHFITYDRNGSQVGVYNMPAATIMRTTKQMMYVGVGPYDVDNENPVVVTGATDFFDASVYYYDFYLYDAGSVQISERKRIYLDRECAEQEYNILFMDRKGTFNTFSFTAKETIEFENRKQTFINDGLGRFENGQMSHDTTDRGYTVYDSRQIKNFTVRNSQPGLTQEESEYFMQLDSSPVVFWMKAPELWIPIVVNDISRVQQSFESDTFIQYDLKFSLANNENINW